MRKSFADLVFLVAAMAALGVGLGACVSTKAPDGTVTTEFDREAALDGLEVALTGLTGLAELHERLAAESEERERREHERQLEERRQNIELIESILTRIENGGSLNLVKAGMVRDAIKTSRDWFTQTERTKEWQLAAGFQTGGDDDLAKLDALIRFSERRE